MCVWYSIRKGTGHTLSIYPGLILEVKTILTLHLLNFLNGINRLKFWNSPLSFLGISRWELESWSANSIEPGQTCRLAWIYTSGKYLNSINNKSVISDPVCHHLTVNYAVALVIGQFVGNATIVKIIKEP